MDGFQKRKHCIHPRSLDNLNREGRKPDRELKKKRHTVAVTDVAWNNLQMCADYNECSISEFLEKLARGYVLQMPSATALWGNAYRIQQALKEAE